MKRDAEQHRINGRGGRPPGLVPTERRTASTRRGRRARRTAILADLCRRARSKGRVSRNAAQNANMGLSESIACESQDDGSALMATVVALAVDDYGRIARAREKVGGDVGEPYLSLAVLDEVEIAAIEYCCAAVAARTLAMKTRVSGIATFQGESPVIYASVVFTEELRTLHACVHEALGKHTSRKNYHPGEWVPHITLCVAQGARGAVEAFSQLLPCSLRGEYTSSALLLVSLSPPEIQRRYQFPEHV